MIRPISVHNVSAYFSEALRDNKISSCPSVFSIVNSMKKPSNFYWKSKTFCTILVSSVIPSWLHTFMPYIPDIPEESVIKGIQLLTLILLNRQYQITVVL